MRRTTRCWTNFGAAALAMLVLGFGVASVEAAETLDIYFVDPGGAVGNATVIVSPSGESAMLDAGLPMMTRKVMGVFEKAGVKQLDYMVNTHYHSDHFGGTAPLAEQIPIVNFVDHGESVEKGQTDAWWKSGAVRGSATAWVSSTTPCTSVTSRPVLTESGSR